MEKEAYEKERYRQTHPYETWIAEHEHRQKDYPPVAECTVIEREVYFPESSVGRMEMMKTIGQKDDPDAFVLLVSRMGRMEPCAPARMLQAMKEQPERDIFYADEDLDEDGVRKKPWFKPDYSPDTFNSIYYFGGVIAFRAGYLKRVLPSLPLQVIPKAWVRALVREGGTIPGHVDEILYHAEQKAWDMEEVTHTVYDSEGYKVSVIIPSRDHPELLSRCLKSIRERTTHEEYEIIVVDNGSKETARKAVEELKEEYGFTYIYEKEEFNFSRMCNRGAAKAAGEVLVFLNDDIEAENGEWMSILAGQALQATTGAAGAKLLYPGEEKRIQHCGISNTVRGPLHKLCGRKDEGSLYHGRNLADYNVSAVTGACLAITRDRFREAGGFDEGLSVAYNDVDLCFTLLEKGYVNVVRNDAVLIHYESASRGSDEDPVRRRRQRTELLRLYERHPGMKDHDPYYSAHLVQERLTAEFEVGCPCDYERRGCLSEITKKPTPAESARGRGAKLLGIDPGIVSCIDEVRIMTDGELQIEGWAAPEKKEAYLYEREIFLDDGSGESFFATVFPKYRPDVVAVLPDQPAGELAGFVARIPEGRVPDGSYRIGLIFRRGKEAVRYTDATLILEEETVRLLKEPG